MDAGVIVPHLLPQSSKCEYRNIELGEIAYKWWGEKSGTRAVRNPSTIKQLVVDERSKAFSSIKISFHSISWIIDIKGSKIDRKVADESSKTLEDLDSSKVYKDIDFESFVGSISPYSNEILIFKLIRDVRFLEKHEIIDYSLLLKICKPSLC